MFLLYSFFISTLAESKGGLRIDVSLNRKDSSNKNPNSSCNGASKSDIVEEFVINLKDKKL